MSSERNWRERILERRRRIRSLRREALRHPVDVATERIGRLEGDGERIRRRLSDRPEE